MTNLFSDTGHTDISDLMLVGKKRLPNYSNC